MWSWIQKTEWKSFEYISIRIWIIQELVEKALFHANINHNTSALILKLPGLQVFFPYVCFLHILSFTIIEHGKTTKLLSHIWFCSLLQFLTFFLLSPMLTETTTQKPNELSDHTCLVKSLEAENKLKKEINVSFVGWDKHNLYILIIFIDCLKKKYYHWLLYLQPLQTFYTHGQRLNIQRLKLSEYMYYVMTSTLLDLRAIN